ncbi:Sec-independent protein translocase protein TatB [uncultured Jannaschia sp.]|uniref:Sec-independent protein translocase protein TatB n=1 Tax=uncultured Jannaschia sp. TaxID=293347 RepID=UPI002607DC96|nr:Sec-independent protein translocase protein TatB [uncultured Jannaschia sp.]
MFDIGWSELLVIGIVALIVVGPKDLPKMFRTLGEFTGKARRMAREFQSAMNEAADESGVNDIAGDLRKIANPKKYGIDKIKEATSDLTAWAPDEETGPNTRDLAEKRADAKARIAENASRMAEQRKAREAAEAQADLDALKPDPAAAPPAKPARAKAAPKPKAAARAKAAPKPKAAATPAAAKAAATPAAKPKAAPKPRVAAKPKTAAKPKAAPKSRAKPKPAAGTDA